MKIERYSYLNRSTFCVKCNNMNEFVDMQLYLFKLDYKWKHSGNRIYTPYFDFPLLITNYYYDSVIGNDFLFVEELKNNNYHYIECNTFFRNQKLKNINICTQQTSINLM